MPNLSPAGQRALTYWGSIQASVSDRATTSEIWGAIRDAQTALGDGAPSVSVGGVNELRGYAAQIRNAGERYENARPEEPLDARMIAPAPWGRSQAEQNAVPMYQIRFEHNTITEGTWSHDMRTMYIRGTTPPTVGDLFQMVDDAGEDLAADYGTEHGSVGSITVLRV